MTHLTDQDVKANPCIKTGCIARIAGRIWRGDLFDYGNFLMLNCSAGPTFESDMVKIDYRLHLDADTWQATHQDDRVVIIDPLWVSFFSYDGVPTTVGHVTIA